MLWVYTDIRNIKKIGAWIVFINTSEFDVYRCHILTYTDGSRAEEVNSIIISGGGGGYCMNIALLERNMK